MAVSRTDTSTLGRWWWSVDRWTLAALLALIAIGYVMMLSASPAVASRIGATSRHMFLERQVFYSALAILVMVGCSMFSPRWVLRFALLGAAGALFLTAMTLVAGTEIKGARRWLSLPGMSLQPSEFLKPCLAVVCAWLIAEGKIARRPVETGRRDERSQRVEVRGGLAPGDVVLATKFDNLREGQAARVAGTGAPKVASEPPAAQPAAGTN